MEKEVEDIIEECINPNFVELPEVIEVLPTPDMRGKYNIASDTEVEGVSDLEIAKEDENCKDEVIKEDEVRKSHIVNEKILFYMLFLKLILILSFIVCHRFFLCLALS